MFVCIFSIEMLTLSILCVYGPLSCHPQPESEMSLDGLAVTYISGLFKKKEEKKSFPGLIGLVLCVFTSCVSDTILEPQSSWDKYPSGEATQSHSHI